MREEMQQLFRDAVAASGTRYETVRGNGERRLHLAVDAINDLCERDAALG
jgi:hypothetical protein